MGSYTPDGGPMAAYREVHDEGAQLSSEEDWSWRARAGETSVTLTLRETGFGPCNQDPSNRILAPRTSILKRGKGSLHDVWRHSWYPRLSSGNLNGKLRNALTCFVTGFELCAAGKIKPAAKEAFKKKYYILTVIHEGNVSCQQGCEDPRTLDFDANTNTILNTSFNTTKTKTCTDHTHWNNVI